MRFLLIGIAILFQCSSWSQYAPAANQTGTTAIHKDSAAIVGWAVEVTDFQRGYEDIAVAGALVTHGDSTAALGVAEGNSSDVVSLGDAGSITLTFAYPIKNEDGPDFAVFENSFDHAFLELAFVEVSTNGQDFVRFPSHSLTQTTTQTGGYENTDPTKIHNLAGKYKGGYGTPFDLSDVKDSSSINVDSINYVRIIDVVGSISPTYGSVDSQGNLINDPYPSAHEFGGFDLDAVGVLHENNIFASMDESFNDIGVYPNPTKGIIQVSSKGEQQVQIIDLSGKRLFETEMKDNIQLDLKALGLTKGMYILQVGDRSEKIILQ